MKIKDKGFRGDYSGRKSRRIKRSFSYRKLKERIVYLARRYGIAVKEINPAYTSVIGMLKYAPQLSLTKDIASAWVIARRGLGFKERIPENYRLLIESPQCESGRAEGLTNGRNPSAPKFLRGTSYNPWRVVRVAVLTALSPDLQRFPRCGSPLKVLLISGEVGRTLYGRETLLPGAGSMGDQMPPAGFLATLKRRGINSPAPELCRIAQFG